MFLDSGVAILSPTADYVSTVFERPAVARKRIQESEKRVKTRCVNQETGRAHLKIEAKAHQEL